MVAARTPRLPAGFWIQTPVAFELANPGPGGFHACELVGDWSESPPGWERPGDDVFDAATAGGAPT